PLSHAPPLAPPPFPAPPARVLLFRPARAPPGQTMNLVEARNLPRHVGIIMDGNGRWAESRGEPREAGHKAGSAAVRRIVRVCRRLGIEALTLYAFSEQNWTRPVGEVDALMGLLREFLVSERSEILEREIRLVAI